MATDRVEFSFSIEKMTFSFKGDRETGQGMQRSIERSIGSLVDAQSRVIGVEDVTDPPPAALPAPPVRPARRRRRSTAASTAGNGASPAQEGEQQEPRQRRAPRSGPSLSSLVDALIGEGYFTSERATADVRQALVTKGFNFKANSVAMTLLNATRKEKLTRRENEQGDFLYRKPA